MSTAIALLSGKGGSGKTTLALTLADLLSRCETRTLLIDCDLSTNGATYFYESQLLEANKDEPRYISSFSSILSNQLNKPNPLKIKSKLDFLPSVSEVSERTIQGGSAKHGETAKIQISNLLMWARKNYDVILFDCQAGYSEFLPDLLPMLDVDLFVLEADSISASAMRSLHLKVGSYFGQAKLYQVFNKATPEEFEVYSKITGTFFTNIGTLLFDWKVRQAFSRSQIPDLENTSAEYGADLCDICKIICSGTAAQKGLDRFSAELRHKQLEIEQEKIRKKLDELSTTYSVVWDSLRVSFAFFAIGGLIFMLYQHSQGSLAEKYTLFSSVVVLVCMMIVMLVGSFFMSAPGSRLNIKKERMECRQKLKKNSKELENLEKTLGDLRSADRDSVSTV